MEKTTQAGDFATDGPKDGRLKREMAVGHEWYHFGVGAPPVLVYFSGHWDVHCKHTRFGVF